ncbi:MAG: LLM class flavin-dependent oxidoreductase [Dehalococcoidia bacterium]|nr:LLM class flavin-dependent oxidoreductase [Dehalococcoidia bacterium]
MHYGLTMECDYRYGTTAVDAFDEAFDQMQAAEDWGLDGVWLAERHFAAPKGELDLQGTGIPSVVSAPLIIATAIAARTQRIKVGVAVNVLPLAHPVRMAEEIATLDHISQGRFEFGVGRSGFARAYQGYNISYDESRDRFRECLEVILAAWSNEYFSYEGKYYQYNDVCVIPKPLQKPYPMPRIAATTKETFPFVGKQGYRIFVGLRGMDVPELSAALQTYRDAWHEAGHEGDGDVILRIPVYVAETPEAALSEPMESTLQSYRRLGANYSKSTSLPGATATEERASRGEKLGQITYDDLLRDRLAYGTPEEVAQKLRHLKEELKLSGVIAEVNVGGQNSRDRVLNSIKLFAQDVVPQCR